MGTLKTCDICLGAVKDEPIIISIRQPAKRKEEPLRYTDSYDELVKVAMTSFFEKRPEEQNRTELCEFCGLKLIGLIEAAKKVGKRELEQFKGLLER